MPTLVKVKRRLRLLHLLRRITPGTAVLFAGVSTVPLLTAGPARQPAVHGALPDLPEQPEGPAGELVVMTLNLAHGRSNGFHQVLQSARTIRRNLTRVGEVIDRERPHVVALQEADGPSLWSGHFDHVRFVAQQAGYRHWLRGEHVVGPRTRYGTGLVARIPTRDPFSVTFQPSPPTLTKGFVVTTVTLPGRPGVQIDVVSLHLDFARSAVRQRQIEALIATLGGHPRPRVIMGDFNTDWRGPTLRQLCERLDLRAWQPEAPGAGTFPFNDKRLDWILASPTLRIAERRVLPDVLSDHRAVLARLVHHP